MKGLKKSLMFLGLGVEIVSSILLPGSIGYYIDLKWASGKAGIGLILGLLIGLVLLFFRLKKIVLSLSGGVNEENDSLKS
jgi:F0F1-type ATP synthase assembly protein I